MTLGAFADNVLRQALLIGLAYGAIASPGFIRPDDALPVIGALLPLAIMLFSPLSGQLADRFETSMMFRRVKAVEIVLMLIAACAFTAGNGAIAVFMLFLMGAQSAFLAPVRLGAMPKYLAPGELVRGNALCNAGLFGAILVGYAVGGALIVREGGGANVGAVLVASALFGWLAALRAPPAAANAPDLKLSGHLLRQTVALFGHARDGPGVAPTVAGVGVFFFLTTAVTVLTPLLARDTLNAEADVATALNGLFAIGAGLGAAVAASLAKGRSGLGWATAGVAGSGAVTIVVALAAPALRAPDAGPFTIAMLATTPAGLLMSGGFIASSALMGLYIAPLQAAMQRRAPAASRARVMAASSFANAAFAIPGSLSVLLVTRSGADPSAGFLLVGVGMLLISAVMLHRRRTLPEGLHDEMLAGPSLAPVDDPAGGDAAQTTRTEAAGGAK